MRNPYNFNSELWLIGYFSASGQASNEDHSVFFPASIKYEPVDLFAASENKVSNPTFL